MIEVAPGEAFDWIELQTGETGLVGTLAVQIDDGTDTQVYGPTSAGIIELGASGAYVASIPAAPVTEGQFLLMASTDGTFDPDTLLTEELVVSTVKANPWNEAIEAGFSAEELLRLMAAVLLGKASGGGTTTRRFRDVNDSVDRVEATVEADGDRTAVTLDPS
jgi:hypothetical protein